MKNLTNNKTKLTATIALVFLMISAFMLTLYIPVQAQLGEEQPVSGPLPSGVTPSLNIKVKAYLSFRPNPVGLDQIFMVNIWTSPALSVERFHANYTVTITKPDGEEIVIVMDSYCGDGTAWFECRADQVGTWKLKFDFLGTYFPAGRYYNGYTVTNTTGTLLDSAYYLPASTSEQKLVVQEEQVLSWPPADLPTDYWTRPASLENREWWPILGNYPPYGIVGGGPNWPDKTNKYMSNYAFVPYVQAPNSAHILWKRMGAISGLIGGTVGQYGVSSSSGGPNVVYAGRCYQTYTKPGVGRVAACYDLRTGEIYYEIPTAEGGVTPEFISYARSTRVAVPGATESTGYSVSLLSIGTSLKKIDPYTGAVTLDVPGMTPCRIGGAPGSYFGNFYNDPYVLSLQTLGPRTQRIYCLINWTIDGNEADFEKRIVSNITLPWSSREFPDGRTRDPNLAFDFESEIIVGMLECQPMATGSYYGTTIMAANMKTGALLWNITIDETRYSSAAFTADQGKVALDVMERGWMAWDLDSGELAWTGELMDYPWSQPGFGAYDVASAYGLLYRYAYDGVYAFNWTNGEIVWKYKAPANAYETPFIDENGKTVYSFNAGGIIADGKLYTYNTEHSPTLPLTRGWTLHCINAKTGEGIWNITGSMSPTAIADGYLTAANTYDGYMYVFGKGKSETTVTAPDVAVPKGTAITIKGTVLDQSPAQPGTPCVSKESMATQMEYLHMKHPIDGLWHNETITGVPVTLTAVSPDSDWIDLGTTTTDGYYGNFGLEWTPTDEGKYQIIVSFEGDDSYGSSSAATYVTVGPAVEEVDVGPIEGSVGDVQGDVRDVKDSISSLTTYIIVILVIVIIALVIAVYSLLKPRK
jgi:hypothetical protein